MRSSAASDVYKRQAGTLFDRLSRIGAGMWPRTLAALERGGLVPTPQEGEPVYAEKISKDEARIDWTRPAAELDCHIRGLNPFPGAWCQLDGKRIKVHFARLEAGSGKPGTSLDDKLLIACGEGALRITDIQAPGKPKMSAEEFLRGMPVGKGSVFN